MSDLSTARDARGRVRAERPGAAGAVAVPGRAVLRWLEVWAPQLVGLALLFAASFAVGVVAAVTFAAYGRR